MSIVSPASQRQFRVGKCNMRQGSYLWSYGGCNPGSSSGLQATKGPKKGKKNKLGGDSGWSLQVGSCWRCFLVKVKVNINFAVPKVGGKAPGFTASVNNLLCLEPIQFSLFASLGLVWLVVLTQNFSLWCIYSPELGCCFMQIKQKGKNKEFHGWLSLPPIHLYKVFFYLFFFGLFDDLKDILGGNHLVNSGGFSESFNLFLCSLLHFPFLSHPLISYFTCSMLSAANFLLWQVVWVILLASCQWQKYVQSSQIFPSRRNAFAFEGCSAHSSSFHCGIKIKTCFEGIKILLIVDFLPLWRLRCFCAVAWKC